MVWELKFDEKGGLRSGRGFAGEVASSGVTDLFVFSHGWNTSEEDARKTCADMFPLIADAARGVAGLGQLGFASVFWPSLWFPSTPATSTRAAGALETAGGVEDVCAGTEALSGKEIAESLATGFDDAKHREQMLMLGHLLDDADRASREGASDEELARRLEKFHGLLRSLAPVVPEPEDAGERALLTSEDPTRDYQDLADAFGTAPAGGAQEGIGDWFGKALGGAKDALRVFSYTTMKARAGTIGRTGLGPLLAELHAKDAGVRVHLIGHSFGARLVSYALAGVGSRAASPIASLLLVQGAFSHWTFAQAKDNPFGENGALHTVADRVHGPLVATFSEHDFAVCRWYPKASFVARQDTEAVVTNASRWNGMGEDGFQAVTPVGDRIMRAEGGKSYGFRAGAFYRVDAAAVINKRADAFAGAHADFRKPAIAQLAVAAAVPA